MNINGTRKKWGNWKKTYPQWDFSTEILVGDQKDRMMKLWREIGRQKNFSAPFKFTRVNTLNSTREDFRHFCVLIDISESMDPHRTDVISTVKTFLDTLAGNLVVGDLISVVNFNDTVQDILIKQTPTAG